MRCPNTKKCQNACPHVGYCVAKNFQVLRAEELKHAEIVRSARSTIFGVTVAEGVKPAGCREMLYEKLWLFSVQPVDNEFRPAQFDMDCFEPSDTDIDNDIVPIFDERQREFFRTNACSKPNTGRVFVTARWHKQFLTMASIIGAYRPDVSQWWPRIINGKYVDPRVANDNRPPKSS